MVVGDLNLNLVIKENIRDLILNMEGDCEEPQVVKVEEAEVFEVEEGEISDSASVEEISEAAFNFKQPPPQPSPPPPLTKTAVNPNSVNANNNNSGGSSGGVWTMRDLCKYRIASKTSYSGLHNLAWAQAVNNRPLGEVFVMMEDGSNDNSNSDNDNSSSKTSENRVVIDVERDGEKEEGELEEGEIDLDSVSVVENKQLNLKIMMDVEGQVNERDDLERTKRVDSIMEELGNLNAADSLSYDSLCSRLETTAIKLQKMVLEGPFPEKDTLVSLLLAAIQNLYSVFSSLTLRLKQQNKAVLSRLLAQVASLWPPLFMSSQLKEVDAIRFSLESSLNDGATITKQAGEGFNTTLKRGNEPTTTVSMDQSGQCFPVQFSKPGIDNQRPKGLALPLLDLHKDHDADSLPSPTRDLSATFPFDKELILDRGMLKPEWPIPRQNFPRQNPVLHPYETDAVKAVSSYHQKFGRGSFFVSDNLPSPTPSEEGYDNRDGEVSGEVSSNPAVNSLMSGQPVLPSATSINASMGPEISNARIVDPTNNFQSPVLKSTAAKSRDPRLRLANLNAGPRNPNQSVPSIGGDESKLKSVGVLSSRKLKIVDELVSDGPAPKRQKNELSGSETTTLPIVTAISTSQVAIPTPSLPLHDYTKSPVMSQNENIPVKISSASSPLHSLLRVIVGNPSVLMSLLKMELQKSSRDNNSATQMPTSTSVLGSSPSTSGFLPLSSMVGRKPAGIVPVEAVSVEEPGKVRMKPRDPRRILHNNPTQKSVTAITDQPKANALSCSVMISNSSAQGQEDQLAKLVHSSNVKPPDITMQFTNNLRNIADIMSISQPCVPSPILPRNAPSHPVHQAGTETKTLANESVKFQSASNLTSEFAPALPSRPLNASAWSDVEHLFDGFDDKQKAAIQKERARRIEEQNKMFAASKLCLVLDLDHTLLNSAKFVEVDPQHDEMLRKKEEQDREKPQRHLFRFPHMGMWTKLRPGIWNFLEKASKLYELHLYTMGNKYYATEMAKLLDPKGELFSGRVISRGNDSESFDSDDRVPKSKDFEGVLGMESAAIIIDDSVRVWPHNKPNLIVVERYIYFPCSRRQFGLLGPSLLEIDHDERPEDGTLASCLSVIERIHKNFFEHDSLMEGDVRNILASEQRKILAGCRIVFSRMFPVDEAKPHKHPLWQTAEQFGAVCINQIDEQVTHVVANSLGTNKVNWALSRGRFVVYPGWVEASALLYRRANEQDFAIKPQ